MTLKSRERLATLPNIITILRIVISFAFLYFSAIEDWAKAFPIFCVAAGSDLIDGAVARLSNQKSRLGAFLDPTADKLLMFFTYVTLTSAGVIPAYLTTVVVLRDVFIVFGLRHLLSLQIEIHYKPTVLSKVTTALQFITAVLALWATRYGLVSLKSSLQGLYVVTTLITVVTGIQYYQIGRQLLKQAPMRL